MADIIKKLEDLRQRVSALNETKTRMTVKVESLKKEIAEEKKNLEALGYPTDIDAAKAKLAEHEAELEKELKGLDKQISELETDLKAHEDESEDE